MRLLLLVAMTACTPTVADVLIDTPAPPTPETPEPFDLAANITVPNMVGHLEQLQR
ncbi:MAG: hypothetical protein ACI9MC_003763, partial [Kiritimatiellia bacterium]